MSELASGEICTPHHYPDLMQKTGRFREDYEMPVRKEYTPEFKDQAVRFVLEEIELDESRQHTCERLAPKLSVKAVTLRQ